MKSKSYIIGIDGGASYTTGVIFDNFGCTLANLTTKGTNLNVYKKLAVSRIINLIKNISELAEINLADITAIGLGISGISDLHQRELLLKELDSLNISRKSVVLSDTEAAYRLLCPTNNGVLISVGTGVVGMGRKGEKMVKVAGKGHENSDLGSGYWIGKQVFRNLLLNSNIININKELSEMFHLVKKKFNITDISSISNIIDKNDDLIFNIASISLDVIEKAQSGNDLALSIIQEATTYVADYITFMFDSLNYDKNDVIISCNGSIIKNNFYRKLLSDALQFEFKKIHWVFSDISSAYGAGLIASDINNVEVSLIEINKGISDV